jgi:hypothetical protein
MSILINGLLVWYIRRLLLSVKNIDNLLQEFQTLTTGYAKSLDSVYGMEMYHGEPIIQQMMENTKLIIDNYFVLRGEIDNILDNQLERQDEPITKEE